MTSGAPAQFATRFAAQFVGALALTGVSVAIARLSGALAVSIVAVLLFTATYYTCFEGLTGRTTGKRLPHIKVVDDVIGKPIGPPKALLRFVLSWASFVALLGGGYFWVLNGAEG